MIELFVILAIVIVALVIFSILGAVFHLFGQVVGAAFSFLGWLIALLVPVALGLLAIGVVLLAFLVPAIVVGGGLWFALRAWLAPRRAQAV